MLSGLAAMPAFAAQFDATAAEAQTATPLASWNDGPVKQAILDFVRATTDPSSKEFVPLEERLATFDQDGTLWVEHPMYEPEIQIETARGSDECGVASKGEAGRPRVPRRPPEAWSCIEVVLKPSKVILDHLDAGRRRQKIDWALPIKSDCRTLEPLFRLLLRAEHAGRLGQNLSELRSASGACRIQGEGSVDFQAIRGRRVTGKAPRRDEYGVAAKGEARRPGVARHPDPRGSRDAPPLGRADRDRGDLEIGARLDLDEGDRAAPSRNKIDFAAADHEAPRENPVALEAQHERCDRFGAKAIKMRAAPPLRPLAGAFAFHRTAPASASARA
jgi:hypothetical protein